jgi:hypothetical protein
VTALELSSEQYHADDTGDTPTLSASIATILTTKSPAHAYAAHPRLNPGYERKDEQKFALGTVAHALLLEGLDIAEVCHFDDWRSNAAKEARDLARAHGRIPILAKHWRDVQEMVNAAGRQLAEFDLDPVPFTDGTSEVCLTWEMEGVKCRALLDWVHTGGHHVSDYKSTSASAHPLAWAKTALSIGADVQVAMHSMGVEAVYGVVPAWRYVVQETYAPYALSVVEPDAQMVALGSDKVRAALKLWRECVASGVWPAYPATVTRISPPGWAAAQWLERDEAEEVAL